MYKTYKFIFLFLINYFFIYLLTPAFFLGAYRLSLYELPELLQWESLWSQFLSGGIRQKFGVSSFLVQFVCPAFCPNSNSWFNLFICGVSIYAHLQPSIQFPIDKSTPTIRLPKFQSILIRLGSVIQLANIELGAEKLQD